MQLVNNLNLPVWLKYNEDEESSVIDNPYNMRESKANSIEQSKLLAEFSNENRPGF